MFIVCSGHDTVSHISSPEPQKAPKTEVFYLLLFDSKAIAIQGQTKLRWPSWIIMILLITTVILESGILLEVFLEFFKYESMDMVVNPKQVDLN